MARALALTLTGAALLAGASAATGNVTTKGDVPLPAVAERSASHGWPHAPTTAELRQLTRATRADVTAWIGTRPDAGRCKTFTTCRFAYREGSRVRLSIRVYEDGSYRIRTAIAGGYAP